MRKEELFKTKFITKRVQNFSLLMKNNEMWPFEDAPNTAIITTKDIINKQKSILLVSHDEEDGM